LGIIRALCEWRHYVQGSPHKTNVYSDHKNLMYFRNSQKLNRQQAGWSLELSKYDLKLIHLPGSRMVQSDALSRRPDFYLNDDDDNVDITLLPDKLFVNLIDFDLQRRIAESDSYDSTAADTIKLLLTDGPSAAKSDLSDWTIDHVDGKPILFYHDKCYVPQNLPVRREIVACYHDAPTACHPGELETYNALQTHYWWPSMRTFVKNYVKGCAYCQQFKINHHPTCPALLPIPGPTSDCPFAHLSMDFITDLPPVRCLDSILSVVDHGLTKGIILIPCSKTGATADATATMILDNVFKCFGLPDKILSDRGPQFTSGMF
jgi:hypothetical protein